MAIQRRERPAKAGESTRAKHYRYGVKWVFGGGTDGARQSVMVGDTKGHEAQAIALNAWLKSEGWRVTSDDPRVAAMLGDDTATAAADEDDDEPAQSVRDLVAEWASRPKLGPSSQRTYGSVLTHLGDLGEMPASAVTAKHVNAWFRGLDKAGAASSSNKMRLTVLKGALGGHVPAGTFDGVGYDDDRHVSARHHLSDAQVADLIAHATPGTGLALPVRFMAETGVRYGEMAGLLGAHVDLEAGTVIIEQQVRQADDRKATGFVGQRTKGKRPRRIPITPELCDALALVALKPRTEPVFEPVGGGYWSYQQWLRAWRRLAKATPSVADDANPHDLRHSAAIRWLKRGVPLGVVSKMLGHANVRITDEHYGQFAEHEARDVILSAGLSV